MKSKSGYQAVTNRPRKPFWFYGKFQTKEEYRKWNLVCTLNQNPIAMWFPTVQMILWNILKEQKA